MLPRKIEADAPEAERRRWRVVRLDTHQQVAGDLISADADSGLVSMTVAGERKDHNFGPGAIAIIGR